MSVERRSIRSTRSQAVLWMAGLCGEGLRVGPPCKACRDRTPSMASQKDYVARKFKRQWPIDNCVRRCAQTEGELRAVRPVDEVVERTVRLPQDGASGGGHS